MSNQQDTKKKNPNVPNLRFSGFEGSWNKVRLSEVAGIIGGGTPDTSNPLYWNGDIDWFTPTEVGESKYVSASKRKITCAGLENSSAQLLPKGSILLSTRASVGPASITTNDKGVTTNQGFQSVVPKCIEDSEFLYYVISNQSTQRELKTKANGSTFLEISKTEVLSIFVSLPKSQKERFKISDFLATIDRRIQLQNKIIGEKERLIKALNDRLYEEAPKKRIRFSEISKSFNGLGGKSSEDFGSGYPFVTYLSILKNRVVPKEGFGYVSIEPHESQNLLKYGDTLLTLSSETPEEVGVASVYLGELTPLYLNSFSLGLRFNDFSFIDPQYAPWLFATSAFRKHIFPFAQGSTRYNLNVSAFMNSEFEIPNLEDQQAFSRLIGALTTEIETNRKVLEEFRRAKKYLLSAMFI